MTRREWEERCLAAVQRKPEPAASAPVALAIDGEHLLLRLALTEDLLEQLGEQVARGKSEGTWRAARRR